MNKFRASNNNLLLKGLFFETSFPDKDKAIYTLKDWDHEVDGKTYRSLYLLFMSSNDPTEYRFARDHLDGWVHWEQLQGCTWFQEYVSRWRRELELRVKSESLARVMSEAKSSSKNSFMANRYLIEKAWEPVDAKKPGRGRPSKDEIQRAASDLARADKDLLEDFKRISTKQPLGASV